MYMQKSEEEFKETLRKIARTTLSSKLLSQERDHFCKFEQSGVYVSALVCHDASFQLLVLAANLAVDAIMRIRDNLDLEQIQMIKRTGGNLKVRVIGYPELPLVWW